MSFHRGQAFPNVVDDPDPDPEFEVTKRAKSSQALLHTWKSGQNRLNEFWNLWRNEYLLNLREKSPLVKKRSKNVSTPPKIGDVVLVKEKLPRGHWRVGRIVKVIKGKDQEIRSARVMVAPNKYLNRAVNMLYPIECPDYDEESSDSDVSKIRNKTTNSEETDQNINSDEDEDISHDLCSRNSQLT